MKRGLFERVLSGIAARDDVRLTFGGWGEPCAHPDFSALIAAAAEAGVFGIHVRTTLHDVTTEHIEAMAEHADIVSVLLDACSRETYNALHGRDSFGAVMENLSRLDEARRGRGGFPEIIVEFNRVAENEHEWEPFWRTHLAAGRIPLVRGFDHLAGQLRDRAIIPLLPGTRMPCARLFAEMFVRCDGTVPVCAVDGNGPAAGDLKKSVVAEVWRGETMERLRRVHAAGEYGAGRLCEACRAWHSL